MRSANKIMALMLVAALGGGCEEETDLAAFEQRKELESLKDEIFTAGEVQEKRARKCVADIEAHFREAVGGKPGALNRRPKDKMGVGTAHPVDSEPVGKPLEGVKYVRLGEACEAVNEGYFAYFKQGKWPDEVRNDEAKLTFTKETLAQLKKPASEPPATIAAYWSKCDKTLFKRYGEFTLNDYDCTLQLVWLDSKGAVLSAATGSGKSTAGAAPTTISERTLADLEVKMRDMALTAAAADAAKKQAGW